MIKNKFDTWSTRDYGPKGGKITKHFLKHTIFQKFMGITPNKTYEQTVYEFKKLDLLYKKLDELYENAGGLAEEKKWLKKKNPSIKINDFAINDAWYLMPPHYGKTNDLFCNDNYIDKICFTDPYYTDRDWVIKSNKFSQQMVKAA
tara:strand:+ start:294 stop:731 length:438 start_codon:yes stop_codon:yes gene_type:complete